VKRLGEVADKINSGKTPLGGEAVYTKNGILFIRSQNVNNDRLELDNSVFIPESVNNQMKNSIVKPNDILLNITGASLGRSCVISDDFNIGNVNQHVCIIRLNQYSNPRFIQPILSSNRGQIIIKSLQTGSGREGLNFESIKNIKLSIPILEEQQKIASFLSIVNDRIITQNKIIKELEVFKSISSKKIFTRQIRFKDSKGNNYSDWKEIKLGNIGETYSGLIGKTKEDFGIGQPYIQYKQIFDSSKIDTTKFGLVTVKSNEHQKKVKKGDVFFTVSSETPDEIGMSSVLLEDIEEIYLNSFCFGFRPNLQILNMHFARYLFRSFTFRDKIMKLAQGSTRYNLSKGEVMKLQISLPQFQEQTQIANFLSSIDSKIDIEIELLKKLEEQKKYLLQNLFV
jgi:type I restriction enzyme S subunit